MKLNPRHKKIIDLTQSLNTKNAEPNYLKAFTRTLLEHVINGVLESGKGKKLLDEKNKIIYKKNKTEKSKTFFIQVESSKLFWKIELLQKNKILPKEFKKVIDLVRDEGNNAIHANIRSSPEDYGKALVILVKPIVIWFFEEYERVKNINELNLFNTLVKDESIIDVSQANEPLVEDPIKRKQFSIQKLLLVLLFVLIGIVIYSIVNKVSKNNNQAIDCPFPNSKDTKNILILPFEQEIQYLGENRDVGYVIAEKINKISLEDKLGIVAFFDTKNQFFNADNEKRDSIDYFSEKNCTNHLIFCSPRNKNSNHTDGVFKANYSFDYVKHVHEPYNNGSLDGGVELIVYWNLLFAAQAKGKYYESIKYANWLIEDGKLEEDLEYLYRGFAYLAIENDKFAIRDFRAALKINPDCAHCFESVGHYHYNKGNYTKALLDYNQAIFLNKDVPRWYYYRALIKSKLNFYDDAEKDLFQCLEMDNNFTPAFKILGYNSYLRGDYNEAISYFTTHIIKTDSKIDLIDSYFYRSHIYSKQFKDYEKAMIDLKIVFNIDPNHSNVIDSYLDNAIKLKDLDLALEYIDFFLKKVPTSAKGLGQKGYIYYLMGNNEGSYAFYLKAAEHKPSTSFYWFSAIKKLLKLNRETEALNIVDKALFYNSKNEELLNLKMDILNRLKMWKESSDVFSEASKEGIKYSWLHYNLANVFIASAQKEKALKQYNESIRLDENNIAAYQLKGLLLLNLKEYEEALRSFNYAISLKGDYPDAFYGKAQSLYALGNRDVEAKESLRKAFQLNNQKNDFQFSDRFNYRTLLYKSEYWKPNKKSNWVYNKFEP